MLKRTVVLVALLALGLTAGGLGTAQPADNGSALYPAEMGYERVGEITPAYIYDCYAGGNPSGFNWYCCDFMVCQGGWCYMYTYCCYYIGDILLWCD